MNKWRGKHLFSGVDGYGKKYVSMSGEKSELFIPIEIEPRTTYKINMEIMVENGNGVIHLNIFGNRNYDFVHSTIVCNSKSWSNYGVFVSTGDVPKTIQFYLRAWRIGGLGTIRVSSITIEKSEAYLLNNVKSVEENHIVEGSVVETIEKMPNNKIIRRTIVDKSLISKFPNYLREKSKDDVILFSTYYKDEALGRQKEIDYCVKANINNPFLDKIVLISDTDDIPADLITDKSEFIYFKEWPTFNKIIEVVNKYRGTENSYNIICNTDMYFDGTVGIVRFLDLQNSCIALSVWAEYKRAILNESSAQGAWIFKGKIKPIDYEIPVGKPGCDNRFLYELHKINYMLYNICYDIIVRHKHADESRKYDSRSEIVPRPYMMIWSNRYDPR